MLAGLLLLACQGGTAAPAATGPVSAPDGIQGTVSATATPGSSAPTAPPAAQATPTPRQAVPTQPPSSPFFLNVTEPAQESVVASARLVVAGCTVAGAFVSVEADVVSLDQAGCFRTTVQLEEGPNSLDVVASDRNGRQAAVVVNVIYVPQRGT